MISSEWRGGPVAPWPRVTGDQLVPVPSMTSDALTQPSQRQPLSQPQHVWSQSLYLVHVADPAHARHIRGP